MVFFIKTQSDSLINYCIVPQCGVFGPLIFKTYIINIYLNFEIQSEIILFVDYAKSLVSQIFL